MITPKQHLTQFMKELSNTEAELKKSVAYKKACILLFILILIFLMSLFFKKFFCWIFFAFPVQICIIARLQCILKKEIIKTKSKFKSKNHHPKVSSQKSVRKQKFALNEQ